METRPKLAADVAYIEGRVFQVDNVNVKFYFDLVPSDMKWIAFFAGELNNAACYFSTFANVSADDMEHWKKMKTAPGDLQV